MLKELKYMATYEYASQSKKNLLINLAMNAAKSAIIDAAFLGACFLFLLVL